MMTRQVVTYPVNVNDFSSLSADWFSRSRKFSPGLVPVVEPGAPQLEGETLAALRVSHDWQTDTAVDGQRSGQMNEDKLRRLELIRAAAEGRK
ncbi:hypothetical protein [Enterobacter ludwigii]|uniref:hypothetical protein n=1 Tax=Enterobacter ludwigii TaxID=299767 RepID=UPI003D6596D8